MQALLSIYAAHTNTYKFPLSLSKKAMVAEDNKAASTTLIFSYGTLKKGFSNHNLIQDLMLTGDATFVGTYRTAEAYPLVCGPYRVPFLINLPGSGHRVSGELYSVSTRGLARMDELEGTSRGHYERLPIKVVVDDEKKLSGGLTCAEAYYAHRSYAMELWRRNGERGFPVYSEKEARGYVKRKDRPRDLSFLDQIGLFVSASDSSPCTALPYLSANSSVSVNCCDQMDV